jgi:hypothetical protein
MRGEAEGPGSISRTATANPHDHVATRLFSTPSVPPETDSMASRGDATPPQHTPDCAGGDHDHGTDHSFFDWYPGATHIQSTETTVSIIFGRPRHGSSKNSTTTRYVFIEILVI